MMNRDLSETQIYSQAHQPDLSWMSFFPRNTRHGVSEARRILACIYFHLAYVSDQGLGVRIAYLVLHGTIYGYRIASASLFQYGNLHPYSM